MADKRLIDSNALVCEIAGEYFSPRNPSSVLTELGMEIANAAIDRALIIIHNAPTINAVEVVRCKECWKRGNERECPMCHEEFDGCDYCTIDYTSDDGFCHMGKKMDLKEG